MCNKRPDGNHNPPPRPSDRYFSGCNHPSSHIFFFTVLGKWCVSSTACHSYYINNMMVEFAHLNLTKLTFFRPYPTLKPHILFGSNELSGTIFLILKSIMTAGQSNRPSSRIFGFIIMVQLSGTVFQILHMYIKFNKSAIFNLIQLKFFRIYLFWQKVGQGHNPSRGSSTTPRGVYAI